MIRPRIRKIVSLCLLLADVFAVALKGTKITVRLPNESRIYHVTEGAWSPILNVSTCVLGGIEIVRKQPWLPLPSYVCRAPTKNGDMAVGKWVQNSYQFCYAVSAPGQYGRYEKFEQLVNDSGGMRLTWSSASKGHPVEGAVGAGHIREESTFVCRGIIYDFAVRDNITITGMLIPSIGFCYVEFWGFVYKLEEYEVLHDLNFSDCHRHSCD